MNATIPEPTTDPDLLALAVALWSAAFHLRDVPSVAPAAWVET